jgi:protein-S-isoprenylcysteine O-methyltransferase Ste14
MGLLGAAGLLQYLLPQTLPLGPLTDLSLPVFALFLGVGLALGSWSVLVLREGGTAVDPKEPTTRLVIRGPFRLTRNPLYLAQLLVMLGFAALTRSWWFLGAVPVLAVLLHYCVILPEERYLASIFGDGYAEYCKKVRRWV